MPNTPPAHAFLAARIRSLRRAGRSRRQIAEALGIHHNSRIVTEVLAEEARPDWTHRPNAKDDVRARARRLRAQGMSYNEIAAELGVSKSSCSLWLRDMPSPITKDERIRRQLAGREPGRARRAAAREEKKEVLLAEARQEIGDLDQRDLLLAGAMLYWCEGAKRKPSSRAPGVSFVNSDPALIRLYLRFLDAAGVDRDDLALSLQIHASADADRAMLRWAEHTGTSLDQFDSTFVKPVNPNTNRRNTGPDHLGCLRVRVLDGGGLYHRIEGWMSGIFGEAVDDDTILSRCLRATELRDRAVGLRRKGAGREAIQERLGIDPVLVDGLLRGVAPAATWLASASREQMLADEMRDLSAQSWGRRRIADHLGVARDVVGRLLDGSWADASDHAGGRVDQIQGYWDRQRIIMDLDRRLAIERESGRAGVLSERDISLLGSVAYWCEGEKRKPHHGVRSGRVMFANSDPRLIAFFVRFLLAMGVGPERWVCRVAIHEAGDAQRAEGYWRSVVGEDVAFRHPTIKRHAPKTVHPPGDPDYHGCLKVSLLGGTDLYQRIEAWVQAVCGRSGG